MTSGVEPVVPPQPEAVTQERKHPRPNDRRPGSRRERQEPPPSDDDETQKIPVEPGHVDVVA